MQVNWQQCYCGMELDDCDDIATVNNDFLIIGRIDAAPDGGQVTCTNDAATWLLRIDNAGEIIWQKCYFNFGSFRMQNAIGSDFYYVMGATIAEPYPDAYNMFVGKMDSTGFFIWERALGNDIGVNDYHFYGSSTDDGGFISSVLIYSQGGDISNYYGGFDGWVIKLDSLGNTNWDFTFGTQNNEAVVGVEQTMDTGYIITGYGRPDGITGNISTPSYTISASDALIIKLDSLGNMEWDKTFGGSDHDFADRAVSLSDGYLIVGGTCSDDGYLEGSGWHQGYHHTGDRTVDIWLVKLDLNGEIVWDNCFGGSQTEFPSRVFSTSDGGFIVFGTTDSHDGDISFNPANGNSKSIWVFKVNGQGQLLWEQCIGGGATERVNGVLQHSDNNYTLAGEMFYSPSGDVNCSNFILGSRTNYWVLGISDTTVSVNEFESIRDYVNVYPNPSSTQIRVDFKAGTEYNSSTMKITDLKGKELYQLITATRSNVIDINGIKPGIYILTIQTKDQLITKKILIK